MRRGSWWHLPSRVTGSPHSNGHKALCGEGPGVAFIPAPVHLYIHLQTLLSDSGSVEGVGLLQATPTRLFLLRSPVDLLQDVGCEVTGTPLTPTASSPDTCLLLSHSSSLVLDVFTWFHLGCRSHYHPVLNRQGD